VKALLALLFLGLALLAVCHSAHSTAFLIIHTGQPLPHHYIQAWAFGNITIVEVAPDNTVVSIGPWPHTTVSPSP